MSVRLSVIIPCYNEDPTLAQVIRTVRATPQDGGLEIILVDDGSSLPAESLLPPEVRSMVDILERHPGNRGKGAAIRTGFGRASGEYVLIQDADLEYHPREYRRLLEPLLAGVADVVYGSRFAGGDSHRVLYFWHYAGNRALTLLSNMCTNLNLTDMETGYKVFRRSVLEGLQLRENRFGIEPEITAKISRVPGVRIYEVGISYFGRTYAEGKKIDWKDGLWAIVCILRYGLLRR